MTPGGLLSHHSFPSLKDHILKHTGLSYYADKDEDLATRISRRLIARNLSDAAEYLHVLERTPAEMDCLVGELTIGETYFFRQPEHFNLLRRTILPELFERKASSRRIRIWSAGCATGAEPYSLAILLECDFAGRLDQWDVSILATDINVEFLAQARAASFAPWALRETPADIQARCFRREGNRWVLLPKFRGRVTFKYHNLASDTSPADDGGPFDLILCRNVLIYFSQDTIQQVAGRLYNYVEPEGWLLVGHAEPNSQNFRKFEVLSSSAGTVYRRSSLNVQTPPIASSFTFDFNDSIAIAPSLPPLETPPPPIVRAHTSAPKPSEAPFVSPLAVDDVRLLADRGRWDIASEVADRLVRSDPLNASAQFTLALILEHAGDHEGARAALRRAIYLDRTFALAHYHLGTSLQGAGEPDSARRSFTTVLRLVHQVLPGDSLPHGDGITAKELADLARMHLELLAK